MVKVQKGVGNWKAVEELQKIVAELQKGKEPKKPVKTGGYK